MRVALGVTSRAMASAASSSFCSIWPTIRCMQRSSGIPTICCEFGQMFARAWPGPASRANQPLRSKLLGLGGEQRLRLSGRGIFRPPPAAGDDVLRPELFHLPALGQPALDVLADHVRVAGRPAAQDRRAEPAGRASKRDLLRPDVTRLDQRRRRTGPS